MAYRIYQLLSLALDIYYFAIIARVLLSWVPIGDNNNTFVKWILKITDPVIRPCQALIQRVFPRAQYMPFDFSPILAIFLIDIVRRLIFRILFIFV